MTTILIAEDDAALRSQLVRLLGQAGYATLDSANGRLALEQLRQQRAQVVVADINMPELDGFGLVEAMRADPATAATPVLLLTGRHDRASMRRGMVAGADDFLAKPFAPAELLEAVAGLLRKRARLVDSIEVAVADRIAAVRRELAAGGRRTARPQHYGLAAEAGAVADRSLEATVMFADIRNSTALADALDSTEVAELLATYFERTCAPVLEQGGRHLKFTGDGLMCLFADDGSEGSLLPAGRRAISAALGVALATHEFRHWFERRFAGRGLPPVAIGIGLHAGEVTLCRLGTAETAEVTPIGDTVNVAARLESASKELGWTVVASRAVLARAGAGVQTGAAASLALRGRSEDMDVVEITGLSADPQAGRNDAVQTAVQVNAAIAATAPDGSPVTIRSAVPPDAAGG
jgi:class 3 adenylate cyclase